MTCEDKLQLYISLDCNAKTFRNSPLTEVFFGDQQKLVFKLVLLKPEEDEFHSEFQLYFLQSLPSSIIIKPQTTQNS